MPHVRTPYMHAKTGLVDLIILCTMQAVSAEDVPAPRVCWTMAQTMISNSIAQTVIRRAWSNVVG